MNTQCEELFDFIVGKAKEKGFSWGRSDVKFSINRPYIIFGNRRQLFMTGNPSPSYGKKMSVEKCLEFLKEV